MTEASCFSPPWVLCYCSCSARPSSQLLGWRGLLEGQTLQLEWLIQLNTENNVKNCRVVTCISTGSIDQLSSVGQMQFLLSWHHRTDVPVPPAGFVFKSKPSALVRLQPSISPPPPKTQTLTRSAKKLVTAVTFSNITVLTIALLRGKPNGGKTLSLSWEKLLLNVHC